MNPSIIAKLKCLQERYEELERLLSTETVVADQERFCALSREHAQLIAIVHSFTAWQQRQKEQVEVMELLDDPDLGKVAQEELVQIKKWLVTLEKELHLLLLPRDPNDERACFLEIHAGTGGDEAALFASDLLRMYSRYAELRSWQYVIMHAMPAAQGGFKEVIVQINGVGAHGALKFESGGHRVQRVPITESQGRIHTSTCTVAVLSAVPEAEVSQINPADLKIDTFRSSGAGGQHVNTTDSAIRITHLPTKLVVECQDERSQHKNRAKAMAILAARIRAAEEARARQEQASLRRNLLGSGARSDRIRTYNFPQNRVTDHRINLTLYCLEEVLSGHLASLINPLLQEHQADLLSSLAGCS